MRPVDLLRRHQRLAERERGLLAELERARERLARDPEVERFTAELEAARSEQQRAALRLRDMEREIAGHRDRMKAHERELMSGRIRSPSDLSRMSAEVEHMKSRLATEEDAELEVMTELDDVESRIRGLAAELERARAAGAVIVSDLGARVERAEDELAQTRTEMGEVWAQVPSDYQSAYRRLSRLPNPVAEVAGGQCGACRVGLTASELQQVRRGDRVITCQSCQRILVAV